MLIEERIKTTLEDCEALQKAVSSLIDNLAYLVPAPQESTEPKVLMKPKAAIEISPEPRSPAENDLELLQSRLTPHYTFRDRPQQFTRRCQT